MTRKRLCLAGSSALGVALLAWTVMSVGPRELATQLRSLAPVLALLLAIAAFRFLLQAAGWRLAMTEPRPAWHEAFWAVVAGEAAGYFAWGPVSREPMKALLVSHRLPQRDALKSAVVERSVYTVAAACLVLSAIAIVAERYGRARWIVVASLVVAVLGGCLAKYWRRVNGNLVNRPLALSWMASCGVGQEALNLLEAYVVLTWLGAAPTIASVVVLEGISRLLNGAGQFIPGKLGITEAATAALAESLRLGAGHGLSLALARRVRALIWGAAGIVFVTMRAADRGGRVREGADPVPVAAAA
jgi:hypothetical protein